MTRFTFICHAATSAVRRAAFPLDEPLDVDEIAKITALNWQVPRAQRILSAPERRTQQTAKALGLVAETTTELRDCNYGDWNGRDFDEVHLNEPEGIAEWLTNPLSTPHGGNSISDLIARVGKWLDKQTDPGHTIAVTHPAVIRGAIVIGLNAPTQTFWRIDIVPLSITDLRFSGKAWTLRSTSCPLQSRQT
jgi:broad specificity phosphatase PhoE